MSEPLQEPDESPPRMGPELPEITPEQWRRAIERATHDEAHTVARAQAITLREAYQRMGLEPPEWADDLDDEVDDLDGAFRDR